MISEPGGTPRTNNSAVILWVNSSSDCGYQEGSSPRRSGNWHQVSKSYISVETDRSGDEGAMSYLSIVRMRRHRPYPNLSFEMPCFWTMI